MINQEILEHINKHSASTPTELTFTEDQINKGALWTKEQLMKCIISQCDEIDKLSRFLDEACRHLERAKKIPQPKLIDAFLFRVNQKQQEGGEL
tara:strand:- start:17 stop:298 length:282 start_codon:yes stop_codon:yes gene_type:complete